MAFWDKEELLVSIQKNKSQNIDVRFCIKSDKEYIDIRTSYLNKSGEYYPSSNGVAIPKGSWNEIMEAVNKFNEK